MAWPRRRLYHWLMLVAAMLSVAKPVARITSHVSHSAGGTSSGGTQGWPTAAIAWEGTPALSRRVASLPALPALGEDGWEPNSSGTRLRARRARVALGAAVRSRGEKADGGAP
jgi:hypothetical protein